MNPELSELYQEIIIDHNKSPRNHHKMDAPTVISEGYNPLCGDKLSLYLKVTDNMIEDISFEGCGCAISQASASLMTEAVKGKTLPDAKTLFTAVHAMITIGKQEGDLPMKLQVLSGVKEFPARVKCATLAWHTLEAALSQKKIMVTTE